MVENPYAELRGGVEAIPAPDASFHLVVCTKVLEHADDPAQAVRELRRVTAPGGRVLASTHGVQVYHPSPRDHWRWTHEGLEKLFLDTGDWASVDVRPASGTTACVAMLLALYVDIAAKRSRARPLARAFASAVNRGAEALDRRAPALREPRPGALFANLHATADVPG